ncbi:unnamed protein product [Peronospora farinosa]|nr:unnamed protein product [Peronospora farinosa]
MGLEGFKPGTAYTLVTRNEAQFAAQLVYNMDVSGQTVSSELLALAKRDARFHRGRAAAGSANGAEGGQRVIPNQQHTGTHDGDKNRAIDAEDAVELDRWNDSRRKSKSDQRKGLGFAGTGNIKAAGVKPVGMSGFVKASAPATSLATAFRSGFVKSTLRTDTVKQPSPPNVSFVSSQAAPLPPVSIPSAPMNKSSPITAPPLQQSTQFAGSDLSSNNVPLVPPLFPPAMVVPPDDTKQVKVKQSISPTFPFKLTENLSQKLWEITFLRSPSSAKKQLRQEPQSQPVSETKSGFE